MQIGDKISAQIGIRKASAVEGQYGPQWELECDVQWSKYPERFWIPREANEPPPSGIKMVTLERVGLKDGKDGTAQFHWKYRIAEGEATVADAPQAHDVGGTQTQPPQKKDSYTLGVIFGNLFTNAVQMHLKHGENIHGVDRGVGMAREDVLKWFRVLNDTRLEAERYFYSMTDAPSPQPQTQPAPTQPDTPEPKNLGEFLTIARQRWGLTKSQVADTLKLDLATIVDFGQALAQLEFAQMENVKG